MSPADNAGKKWLSSCPMSPEVFAPENVPVEKIKIIAAHANGGSHILSRRHRSGEITVDMMRQIMGSANDRLPPPLGLRSSA